MIGKQSKIRINYRLNLEYNHVNHVNHVKHQKIRNGLQARAEVGWEQQLVSITTLNNTQKRHICDKSSSVEFFRMEISVPSD